MVFFSSTFHTCVGKMLLTCCVFFHRLSIRAFTQLFSDDDSAPPVSALYTDTFLSLPVYTDAGERKTHK